MTRLCAKSQLCALPALVWMPWRSEALVHHTKSSALPKELFFESR